MMKTYTRNGFLQDLKKQKNDPEEFKKAIQNYSGTLTIGDYRLIGKYHPKALVHDEEFVGEYSKRLVNFIRSSLKRIHSEYNSGNGNWKWRKKYGYKEGNAIPQLINHNYELIPKRMRKKLMQECLGYIDLFYPYGKQAFFNVAFKWFDKKEDLKWIGNSYFHFLSKKQQKLLLDKIDLSELDKDVQTKFNKTPAQMHKEYKGVKNWTNTKIRNRFVKDLAKSTTLLRMIDFEFTITKDDLMELPPMMRFNFLKILFEQKIYAGKFKVPQALNMLIGDHERLEWARFVRVEHLAEEDARELLLVAAFRKNQEVQDWVEDYVKFLNTRDKILIAIEAVRKYL